MFFLLIQTNPMTVNLFVLFGNTKMMTANEKRNSDISARLDVFDVISSFYDVKIDLFFQSFLCVTGS